MLIEPSRFTLASTFLSAVRDDQHERARQLLDAHPEIATFSAHTAAAVGHADVLRAFLAADASAATFPWQPDGIEPIIFAATGPLKTLLGVSDHARADVVRELLRAHGANLSDAHADWGNTPLYFLAGYREPNEHIDTVTHGIQWLLERGADPNVPSHVTTRDGSPGVVKCRCTDSPWAAPLEQYECSSSMAQQSMHRAWTVERPTHWPCARATATSPTIWPASAPPPHDSTTLIACSVRARGQ